MTRLEDQFGRIEFLLGVIDGRFDRLEKRMDGMDAPFERLESRFDGFDVRTRVLEGGVAKIEGRISMIPGVWQQMTMIVASQATLAGFLFGALKLNGH